MKQKAISIIKQLIGLYQKLLKLTIANYWELRAEEICKEEGLTEDQTDIILSVIEGESHFDPNARNYNPGSRTTDYGICQFNNYWYWDVEKIISPFDAQHKPELAIRIMIEYAIRRNRINNWCVYSSGVWWRYYLARRKKRLGSSFNLESFSEKVDFKSILAPLNGPYCRSRA